MKFRIKGKDQIFSYDSTEDEFSVGRSSENDFVVPLDDFSRKHCLLTIKGEYVFIMDLGSKNGVQIDGHRIQPNQQFPIYPHTKVRIANFFELWLPDGTSVRKPETDEKSLKLDLPPKKNW